MDKLGVSDAELSILVVSDPVIAELNGQYLGRKGPTDVIAFPQDGPAAHGAPNILGDVVISIDTAQSVGEKNNVPVQHELDLYLVHGILHLMGYDHEKGPRESHRMLKLQKSLLKELNPP